MSTIAYRPEIDGLRGIAVLAAIGWHAQFKVLGLDPIQGGFIGIEIFFVISGYLITLIILREMQQDRFTIRGFYERRARRILPILLTVLLASLPFAWLYMLPKAVEEFAGSVLSMLAFGSNFWFWQESSYWSEAGELKPLLHTWSLSLEEQFYVLFPLLLIVLWKVGVRYIVPVFLVIFVGSLMLTQVSVASDPEGTFFLLLPRMWELIAGALLAVLEMNNGRKSNPKLESSMPWMGLVLICAPIFLFHRDLQWPSLLTAIPVVGTMIVIWYTKPEHPAAGLLRWKPIAGIGLISYSFYLWHFPIFAFARVKGPWPSQWDMVIYILIAFSLSVVTYHLIEKPFRSRRVIALPTFVPIILVATVAVFAVSGYAYVNNGLWGRYTDGQLQMLGVGEDRDPYVDYVLKYAKGTRLADEFIDADDGNDLFVIGDSYSADFLNALNEGGFLEGLEVLGYKISWDCLNVPEASDYKEFLRPKDVDKCDGIVRVGHPDLAGRLQDADFVLLVSSWMDYTTSRLDQLLAAVASETDAAVLIVGRKQFGRMNAEELVSYTEQEFLGKRQKSHSHLKWLKAVPESVKRNYLDLHRLFCGASDSCPVATPEGSLISYDGGHLTRDGAVHLSRLLSGDEDFTRRWDTAFGYRLCPEIKDEGVPCPTAL
jgi:peptidoglycan/LPS O-acetylase OafA/YrhL